MQSKREEVQTSRNADRQLNKGDCYLCKHRTYECLLQKKQIERNSKYRTRGVNGFFKYSTSWKTEFHLQKNKKANFKNDFPLYNKIEKFLNKDLLLAKKHEKKCFLAKRRSISIKIRNVFFV